MALFSLHAVLGEVEEMKCCEAGNLPCVPFGMTNNDKKMCKARFDYLENIFKNLIVFEKASLS